MPQRLPDPPDPMAPAEAYGGSPIRIGTCTNSRTLVSELPSHHGLSLHLLDRHRVWHRLPATASPNSVPTKIE